MHNTAGLPKIVTAVASMLLQSAKLWISQGRMLQTGNAVDSNKAMQT